MKPYLLVLYIVANHGKAKSPATRAYTLTRPYCCFSNVILIVEVHGVEYAHGEPHFY